MTVKSPWIRNTTRITCIFGAEYATGVSFVNDQTLICRSPSRLNDAVVALEITLDGVFFSRSSVPFQFYGEPVPALLA